MLRPLAILSLLPILLLAAPASALTAKQQAETCKIGADAQKLTGAKRTTFISRCMAKGDTKPAARTGTATAPRLTHKQKMETCVIGANDQKLTGAKRKTFINRCMANEPRKKTATAKKPAPNKPTQLVPPPKPQ